MSLSSLEPRLAAVLEPIPGSNPCGESIRYTPLYDSLQEERAIDDFEGLPEGVWQSDLKKVDWPKMADMCLSTLSQKTKDLQVVVWLIEALFFTEGLAGLIRGLKLLSDLSEKFWETLYPLPEDGDMEIRLMPYDWLDYHMPTRLLALMITSPASRDGLSCTFADWVDSAHLEAENRKNPSSGTGVGNGKPTFSDVVTSLKKTPVAFYENLENQAQSILTLADTLDKTIQEKSGIDEAHFYRLKGQINLVLKYLPTWKAQCFRPEEKSIGASTETEMCFPEENLVAEAPEAELPQSVKSRKAAYRTLGKIADFLLAQDPHSPTPYVLHHALEWEDKSLPEIYAEWGQDPQALLFLMRFLGVKGSTSQT